LTSGKKEMSKSRLTGTEKGNTLWPADRVKEYNKYEQENSRLTKSNRRTAVLIPV